MGGVARAVTLNQASDTGDVPVYGNNATYTTAQSTSAAIGGASGTQNSLGQQISGTQYVFRFFLKFDTSSIPDDAAITGVTMSLAIGADNSTTDFDVVIHKYDWSGEDPLDALNRETAYDGCVAATSGSVTWRNTNGIAVDTRYDSPALDTAWVSKTGYTYFCILSAEDVAISQPSTNEYVNIYTGDEGTYYPRLDVEYDLATATATPTDTPTATATRTDTPDQSPTNTDTPTVTPTRTPTATPTSTPTHTWPYTETPTPTFTPTSTMTYTKTFTITMTPSITQTFTRTWTKGPTGTSTVTATPTTSKTATLTASATGSPTRTSTVRATSTGTKTPCCYTPTKTASPTRTATATIAMATKTPTGTIPCCD